ncbi:MAG TPA: methyltransferase domain-containing protein [Solirubrobacteraceae bacterium]|nr:methyltransferase domain-containing protein [Solirubrobacteraceae bacterium]
MTDEQAHLNAGVWERGDFVALYATHELRPAETILLERHRRQLSGRVLELGCGAGRLTGHLRERARELQAVDISPAMIDYCRRAYPGVAFTVGDLRDLSRFASGSLDAVLAPFNVIDVLGDSERRRLLREVHRLLVGDGVFIVSSHNLAHAPAIARPTHVDGISPRALARSALRMPRRVRNHRRLAHMQRRERDYAILVDEAHDFSLLHYYISRDAQQRQFAQEGFELLECRELSGEPVGEGETGASASELYYVARPARTG